MKERWPAPSSWVYRQACNFLSAADLLLDSPNTAVEPYFVNAGLAVELFLKSCLSVDHFEEYGSVITIGDVEPSATSKMFVYKFSEVESEKSKTHCLPTLWSQISQERRNIINREFSKSGKFKGYKKFCSVLNKLDGLFVDARYSYSDPEFFEKRKAYFLPLHAASFLKEAVCQLEGVP
ncbi:hypothetical protein [Oceanospirillum linum]|uniref:hypothetical protein n=1 Tax=Oceanospirillum linum TaxID=966 RepID=UPI00089E7FE3|nr:hypothetical protein [Oceanospirillum linum]SEG27074.1 hypothetical protein SAMN04489856_10783 [Oleiphilus messinensis]SMP27498.1 hypothetical protein SAMN06264348_106128 [Oceanospirillum linum]